MELDEALDHLLGVHRTDDEVGDLYAALTESWNRRRINGEAGAEVIRALQARQQSLRTIETRTGIPRMTVSRWGTPPEQAHLAPPDELPADSPEEGQ